MKHEVFILGGQRIDRKSKKGGREARGNEEREKRGLRKGAIVSSSPQGMTSWNLSIKIWFFQAHRMHY